MGKSRLAIISLICMFMLLVSCGSNDSNSTNNGTDKQNNIFTSGTGEYDKETLYIKASNPEKLPRNAADRKDTLIVGIAAPNGAFNRYYVDSAFDGYIVNALWATLLEAEYDGTIKAGLAPLPEITNDNKTYTFTWYYFFISDTLCSLHKVPLFYFILCVCSCAYLLLRLHNCLF